MVIVRIIVIVAYVRAGRGDGGRVKCSFIAIVRIVVVVAYVRTGKGDGGRVKCRVRICRVP